MKHLPKILLVLCVMNAPAWGMDPEKARKSSQNNGAESASEGADRRGMVTTRQTSDSYTSSTPSSEPNSTQQSYIRQRNRDETEYPFDNVQDNLTVVVTGLADDIQINQQTLRDNLRAATSTISKKHQQSLQYHEQSSKVTHTVNITELVSTVYNASKPKIESETRKETLKNLPYFQKNPGKTFLFGFATASLFGLTGYLAYQNKWLNRLTIPTPVKVTQ